MSTQKKDTRFAMTSPQKIHAAVEGCFSKVPGAKDRKLWRLDHLNGRLYLLLLSPQKPDFLRFAAQFCVQGVTGETKDYLPLIESIGEGQRFFFRLRGNPVHSVDTDTSPRGKIYPHVTVEQKCCWLIKKAKKCGFALEEDGFNVVETGTVRFSRNGKGQVELGVAVFEGELTVTCVQQFTEALTQGVGRAKAYGCGLLTVVGNR